jgi:hypothetical protein
MAPGAWHSNASLITKISCYGDKNESYVNNKNFLEIRKSVCLHTFATYHPPSNRLPRNRSTTNGPFKSPHAELTSISKGFYGVTQEPRHVAVLLCSAV